MNDRALSVRWILAGKAPQGAPVTVKGWVRTRRDSKAGISFVHLSDGSSFHQVQVVAPNTLPNCVGTRALSHREACEEAGYRDELPEGHQGVLHARK
jgi:aspartyl/asparaginyl-tRNA synthetase